MSLWPENEFLYESEDGVSSSSPKEYFWTGVLGLCGCGTDTARDLAWEMLCKLHESKVSGEYKPACELTDNEYFNGLQELIMHIFDAKGITEHGGSAANGWMTDNGFKLVDKLIKDQKAGPKA